MPSTTIERLVARGDLWVIHPGVHAVGRPDLGEYGRAWAGILATRGHKDRPDVRALSHRTAIAVLGLAPFPRSWQRHRRPDFAALDRALRAANGCHGTRKLRQALEPHLGLAEEDHRSLLERLAHRLLRAD